MVEENIRRMIASCSLCPRNCGVDRNSGGRGFCGAGRNARIARAALHFWEEPCISGRNGSGTVFFSNCTMKCIYCQNYEVSTRDLGRDVTERELSDIFMDLQKQGANNINLVTPTHYVPQIAEALKAAKAEGLTIPIVYNTGGYEKPETIGYLDGLIDIYMPDFKYYSNETARKYSSANDYCETVKKAISAMMDSVGAPYINKDGIMERGVIVRHLMLPGCLGETIKIIDHISRNYGDDVYFSLMSQYTPLRHIEEYKNLNRRIKSSHYEFAVNRCMENGMNNVYIQDGEAADESFIPEFSGDKTTK